MSEDVLKCDDKFMSEDVLECDGKVMSEDVLKCDGNGTVKLFKTLQLARTKLQGKKLNKSGYNKHSNFYYYELRDFLPFVNEIFLELGLYSEFNLFDDRATLTICYCDNDNVYSTVFSMPIVEAKDMQLLRGMQALGGINTYAKRYLYQNALEIAENDLIDSDSNDDKKGVKSSVKSSKGASDKGSNGASDKVAVSKKEMIKDILNMCDSKDLEQFLKMRKVDSLEKVSEGEIFAIWKNAKQRQ